MKRTRIEWLGLLGVISLISYAAAVIFAPLGYPGYDWMRQAVSDLSAENSPSRVLWNRIAALYGTCGIVSITAVCIYIKDRLNKPLRVGIYLFAVMNWISDIGYRMFPLSESGNAGKFQDVMHIYVVTALVVALSIISLIVIMIGGFRDKNYRSIAVWALVAFLMMFVGSVGSNAVPKAYFGVMERISLFAAVGFNAVLGVYLFNGFK